MYKKQYSNQARLRRHQRVRKKVAGTTVRPRLSVFRSGNQIYAQVIDDTAQRTLLAASSRDAELAKTSSGKIAGLDGDDAPESLKGIEHQPARAARPGSSASWWRSARRRLGVEQVVFDRGGYIYHGRVAALAEGARDGGLDF